MKSLRLATSDDFDQILLVFKNAINNMCSQGIFQWDEIYPNDALLKEDIFKKEMYVLEDNGKILSAVVVNENQEPEYQSGAWKYNNQKVAVMHRLCVEPACQNQGVGKTTIELMGDML